jgi:peptidoglycan L-alanyl-D-glutamate endopeptidase CwlK
MPSFSKRSCERLATCDPRLQLVFNTAIEHFDCSILEGHRSETRQKEMFETGRSQVQFPESKHNSLPSLAVDVMPYPIDFEDRERMHLFAGFVLATARNLGVRLRWGGDWDSDTEVADNRFDDLVHFELAESP